MNEEFPDDVLFAVETLFGHLCEAHLRRGTGEDREEEKLLYEAMDEVKFLRWRLGLIDKDILGKRIQTFDDNSVTQED